MFKKTFDNLSGKILVASPYTMHGNVFYKSLIYLLSHTPEGSTGLIINHPINKVPFGTLVKMSIPGEILMDGLNVPVHLGGPVDLEKGVFLHSAEYDKNLLFKFDGNLALSSGGSILGDIVSGQGPRDKIFILGYTGWSAGQLEFEIKNNLWIVLDCDYNLIFSVPNELKWSTGLKLAGQDFGTFSSKLGNC